MFTVVIGLGPNSLEIPLLVFSTKEKAKEHLAGLGLIEKEVMKSVYPKVDCRKDCDCGKSLVYDKVAGWPKCKETCAYVVSRKLWESQITHVGTGRFQYKLPDELTKDLETALVTSYYNGCGGLYALEVQEVEEGKPFIGWDLD